MSLLREALTQRGVPAPTAEGGEGDGGTILRLYKYDKNKKI